MNKGRLRLYINNLTWINFKEEYYFSEQLQGRIDEIMYLNQFNNASQELVDCIDYFKNDLGFVFHVIEKNLKPFTNIDQAKRCSAERLLKSFPDATSNEIGEKQLNTFAGTYIKEKVREYLISVYKQITTYSKFVCKDFLKEE